MWRIATVGILAFVMLAPVQAQNADDGKNAIAATGAPEVSPRDYRGLSMTSGFTESHDSTGWTTELTSSIEYDFNKYFSLSAGIPVYLVQPYNATDAKKAGVQTAYNTRGDLLTSAALKIDRDRLSYSATVVATAPTGDVDRGVSTGSPTVNWTNHFEHAWGRVTPFAEAGLGNSASTASLAARLASIKATRRRARTKSYDSQGPLANFQAGFDLDLFHGIAFEPAAYDLLPFGDQTVYSRIVPHRAALPGAIRHHRRRPFELLPVNTGSAAIAADHGFSGTFSYQLARRVDLSLGYTRSINYRLDTVELAMAYRFGHLPPGGDKKKK